jgi:hypothetical protein
MSAFGTKRTSAAEFQCPLSGVKRTLRKNIKLPAVYIAGAIQCGAEMLLLAAPPVIQAVLAVLQGDGVVVFTNRRLQCCGFPGTILSS